MCSGSSGATTSIPSGTITKIKLAQFIKYGADITVSESTGGVTIPAGTYLIAASVYIQLGSKISDNSAGKAHRGVYIKDETDTELAGNIDGLYVTDGACSGGVGLSPKIMSFSTSKTLYLCARSQGYVSTVYNDSGATYLTILRLK